MSLNPFTPMNTPRRHFILSLLAAAACPCAPAADDDFLEKETFGKIKLGQKAAELTAAVGKADSKGKDTEWAATGEWVQEWRFKTQGLTVNMASGKKDGAKTVHSLTATAPCPLATARGIRIGSTAAEVKKAYGKVEDKEQSEAGKTFVAGSVYGGIIFTLKDGKVSQIFLGAAAE